MYALLNNPVLMKEMRSRMRGVRTPLLLLACTAITLIAAVFGLFFFWDGASIAGPQSQQAIAGVGKQLFTLLACLEGSLVALLTPALTAGAISSEREQQTLETLLLTPLTSRNIVISKLLTSLSFVLLLVGCALPVMAITLAFGGVAPEQIIWVFLLVLASAAFFGAIGIFCSVCFRKTVTAQVMTFIICLAWLLLIPFLLSVAASARVTFDELLTPDMLGMLILALGLPAVVALVVTLLYPKITHRPACWPFKAILWSLGSLFSAYFISCMQHSDQVLSLVVIFALACIFTIPLIAVISILYTRKTRRLLSVRVIILLWLPVALVNFLLLCANQPTSGSQFELYLLGNPVIAMQAIFEQLRSTSDWLTYGETPLTILLLFAGAWMLVVLAAQRLDSQRGCRTPVGSQETLV